MVSGKTHVGLNKQENSEYNCPSGRGGGGGNSIMVDTGRLCPKDIPFSDWRYTKEKGFHEPKCTKRLGKTVI